MLNKAAGKMISVGLIATIMLSGCKTPETYRKEADDKAYGILQRANKDLFDKEVEFTIDSPEDQLRQRLFAAQGLQYSGKASLGVENLDKPKHWPEENYPGEIPEFDDLEKYKEPINITLVDALQMAAKHNFSYQSNKESVYTTALALDQQEHYFDYLFDGGVSNSISADTDDYYDTTASMSNTGTLGIGKQLKNGVSVTAGIAFSLSKLLTQNHSSGNATAADISMTVPLLRGSGEHIITESLTQAQRNLVYTVYDFERYKRSFAVSIASSYYNVLRIKNQIVNAKANYESVKTSANRSRELAKAGRTTNIQRDQAIQNELGARNNWLNIQEDYKTAVDRFKIQLGLPTDAKIELDQSELDKVIVYTENALDLDLTPSREDKVEFSDIPGPFELDENLAIKYALSNRLDIKNAHSQVFDSQRDVIIMADRLRAEVTLNGGASYGDDGSLVFDDGDYNALLTIDLPLDRVSERNSYRSSLISLQRAVRSCQSLEDDIKLEIRSKLRDLKALRNSLQIRAESVRLAEDRVRSSNMFLEAGRVEMRDLLDAEEALLSARNNLTSNVISYRMAELELQRDMGLLEIDENGLWNEFDPADAKKPIAKNKDNSNNL